MKFSVLGSPHQSFIVLRDIIYSVDQQDLYVEVFLLTSGDMPYEDNLKLRKP
jgi:hypothetical protein